MHTFIYLLYGALLFFVPLSFASVEAWAVLTVQCVLFFIAAFLLLRRREVAFTPPSKKIVFLTAGLFLLMLAQTIVQRSALLEGPLYPFTLCRIFTLEEASLLFSCLAAFFITTQMFQKTPQIKALLAAIFVSGVLVMLTGLCFPRGQYIKFLVDSKALGSFGPFVNRNHAGIFISVTFFCALAYCAPDFLDYRRYVSEGKKRDFILRQTLFCFLTAALFVTVFFTRSRGAMLSTIFCAFASLWLLIFFLLPKNKKRLLFLALSLLLFTATFWEISKNVDEFNSYARRSSGASEETRIMLYNAAFDMLKDYPLTGVGGGAFSVGINPYLENELSQYPRYLHNDWLELILSIGYPAAFIVLLLILAVIFSFVKRIKNLGRHKKIRFIFLLCGALSIAIGSVFDFHLHIPANAFLFFTVLGLLSSSSFYKNEVKFIRLSALIKIFAILSCIFILAFSTLGAAAYRYFKQGRALTERNKLSLYERGLAVYPSPRYGLKTAVAYYNASHAKNVDKTVQKLYAQRAFELSSQYQKLYPLDKEIAKLYRLSKKTQEEGRRNVP